MERRVVMWRDASLWERPDTVAPKRAHYPHPSRKIMGYVTALCSQHIVLNDDNECYEDEVPNSICARCQKMVNTLSGATVGRAGR